IVEARCPGLWDFSWIEQDCERSPAFASSQKERQIIQSFDLEPKAGEEVLAFPGSDFLYLLGCRGPLGSSLGIDGQGKERKEAFVAQPGHPCIERRQGLGEERKRRMLVGLVECSAAQPLGLAATNTDPDGRIVTGGSAKGCM